MTNKEWMMASCARFGIDEQGVNLIMVNQGVEPNGAVDIKVAKTALCREFASIIPLCNVSEGGFSQSWNMDAIKIWYRQMCKECGVADVTKPKIRNRSNLW